MPACVWDKLQKSALSECIHSSADIKDYSLAPQCQFNRIPRTYEWWWLHTRFLTAELDCRVLERRAAPQGVTTTILKSPAERNSEAYSQLLQISAIAQAAMERLNLTARSLPSFAVNACYLIPASQAHRWTSSFQGSKQRWGLLRAKAGPASRPSSVFVSLPCWRETSISISPEILGESPPFLCQEQGWHMNNSGAHGFSPQKAMKALSPWQKSAGQVFRLPNALPPILTSFKCVILRRTTCICATGCSQNWLQGVWESHGGDSCGEKGHPRCCTEADCS